MNIIILPEGHSNYQDNCTAITVDFLLDIICSHPNYDENDGICLHREASEFYTESQIRNVNREISKFIREAATKINSEIIILEGKLPISPDVTLFAYGGEGVRYKL